MKKNSTGPSDKKESQKKVEKLNEAQDTLEEITQEHIEELQKSNEMLKQEIEAQKEAEDKLKESEEKFHELFNKTNDMITVVELTDDGFPGKYIEVNDVAYKRLGYSKEELLNMSPLDIIAPERLENVPKNAAELREKRNAKFEIVHMTKDGGKIPVENNSHLFELGGKTVILAVSRDITEYKELENEIQEQIEELQKSNKLLKKEIEAREKLEEKLIESEEKFRTIFNKANDMIALNEMNEDGLPGKFIEVNEIGLKRLGYTQDEFLNLTPKDIVAFDKGIEITRNAVELWTKGHFISELVHVTKDGQRIPVEVSNHLIKLNGKLTALAISRDLRIRKK